MARRPVFNKELRGTARPDRVTPKPVKLTVIKKLPDPPAWLPNKPAVEEWTRLGTCLVRNGMLTAEGLMPFGMLCAVTGELVELWLSHKKLNVRRLPSAHLLAQFRSLVNDFGLTPVAQTRINVIEPGEAEEGNPFLGHGDRPDDEEGPRVNN